MRRLEWLVAVGSAVCRYRKISKYREPLAVSFCVRPHARREGKKGGRTNKVLPEHGNMEQDILFEEWYSGHEEGDESSCTGSPEDDRWLPPHDLAVHVE